MKKIFVMALAMLMAVSAVDAQKKAVQTAKNRAMNSETPDFAGAREAIQGALENEETKNDANTWYVAGLIGNKEAEYLINQRYLTGQLDENRLGECVAESYNYWLVADSMAQILVADKKGNMKPANPKLRPQITRAMLDYFTNNYLISYGYSFYEKRDNENAFRYFMMHLNMPKLEMMQDAKLQKQMEPQLNDTNFYTYKQYAVRFAYEAGLYNEAVAVCNQLINEDQGKALRHDVITAKEYLADIAKIQGDTTAYLAQLREGWQMFPDEAWFVQVLINFYVRDYQGTDGAELALATVSEAIAQDPQKQYLMLRGQLYLQMGRYDEALAEFVGMNAPDDLDVIEMIGRTYYFRGDDMLTAANDLNDPRAAREAREQALAAIRQCLEPLERVHEVRKDDVTLLNILKNAYYKLGDYEKNAAIVKEINNL